MKCTLILSVIICLSSAEEYCTPCVCTESKADCSINTVQEIVTHIPDFEVNTEELSAEGQPLEKIYNQTFPRIPNLQLINLQNCKLNFVHRYTFKYMTELIEINLSFNHIKSLDQNIFAYNTKLVKIFLNNNKLHIVKDKTFKQQKSLLYLFLQNNLIPNLTIEAFSNYPALKLLNLTGNNLTNIDSNVIQNSNDLNEVYIDDNPFNCNCYLKPLFEAIKRKKLYGINAKCAQPKPLEKETLIDLSFADFTCQINVSKTMNTEILIHNDTITLTCNIEAYSEPYMSWKFNNNMLYTDDKYQITKTEISPTNFQYNLTINKLNVNDSGQYTCTAKNTGFTNETNYNITMQPAVKPRILIPNTEYIFVDLHEENYTLPFKIFGIPKPTASWIYRDKQLNSQTSDSTKNVFCQESSAGENTYWYNLTIKKVKLKYRTEFVFNASNIKGSSNKTVTLIILYPQNVEFEVTNEYLQTSERQNVTLLCGVKAVPKPDVIWRYGGHFKIDSNVSPNKYNVRVSRDSTGTYWSRLTILQIDLFDAGNYKCDANNSEEIHTKEFTVIVNKIKEPNCDDWKHTLLIAIGCIVLIILLIIIILKCCIRYHVSKNWSQEYSYRGSMLG